MRFLLRLFGRIYVLALNSRTPEEHVVNPQPKAVLFKPDTNYPFY